MLNGFADEFVGFFNRVRVSVLVEDPLGHLDVIFGCRHDLLAGSINVWSVSHRYLGRNCGVLGGVEVDVPGNPGVVGELLGPLLVRDHPFVLYLELLHFF